MTFADPYVIQIKSLQRLFSQQVHYELNTVFQEAHQIVM